MRAFVLQLALGATTVVVVAALALALASNVGSIPGAFFDELGRTVQRALPDRPPDVETQEELKGVIRAMPDGRLRVASVVAEEDIVVFTVTAKRSAVPLAVVPGDELRISRDTGAVEIAPQGIPGLLDRFAEEIRKLKERFFGR